MKFIGNIDRLQSDSLAYRVYDKLNSILNDGEDSLLYYMFPVYSGNIDVGKVECNLLLLSRTYGVFYFDSKKIGETIEVAENRIDNLYSCITESFRRVPKLKKGRNSLKYDIITIFVSDEAVENALSEDFVFSDVNNIRDILSDYQGEIDERSFDLMQSCLDGTVQTIRKALRPCLSHRMTKGAILNEIEKNIAKFDVEQKLAASAETEGVQRIRGLAGSGKTIVLTQKAANYHLKHPDDVILYTYYTKALHDTIKEHISRAYRYFSDNKEPNWEKIIVCHAWGGTGTPGVYSMACKDSGIDALRYGQAIHLSGNDPFGEACKQLIDNNEIMPRYDLILIDEGQDFTPPFYQLCYRLSKTKKITWAYDDFQNIFNIKIQDERLTFGKNEEGHYNVDFERDKLANQDIVLKKCYRTPRYSLISAFSLGLGIYNEKVLQRLDTNDHWESLGFHVLNGDCKITGDEMEIERPEENTPGYSNEKFDASSIQYKSFSNFDAECKYIARSISNDLVEEELRPEDICVICVDRKALTGYFAKLTDFLHIEGVSTFNLVNTASNNLSFTKEGCVTLATVNKAKGNEKGVVYICGADYIFSTPNNVVLRDILFTAMTRTKGWLTITGCTQDFGKCITESNKLKLNQYKLRFIQPSEVETKTIEYHSRAQNSFHDDFDKSIEGLKRIGLSKKEIREDVIKQLQRLLGDD